MGCDSAAAIAFFIISAGFNTFTVPGCKTSMLDFAPRLEKLFFFSSYVMLYIVFVFVLRFSAVIMGFSNTWANFTGFLAPQTTGHLVKSSNSLGSWQLAFWITALIYIPGFLVFLFFGSDQLQEWAYEDDKPKEENKRMSNQNGKEEDEESGTPTTTEL